MGAWKAFMTYVSSPLETIKLLSAINSRLTSIEDRLRYVETRSTHMSAAIDKIRAEIAENKDLVASTKALVSGLAQQIRDAKGDEEALEALASDLDAQNDELAAAVTENTPFTPSGQ